MVLTEKYISGEVRSDADQITSKRLGRELAQVEQAIERAGIDHEVLLSS